MVADDHDSWDPEKLRPRPLRSIVGWIIAAISVYVAAGLVPGVAVDGTLSAFLTAAVIAIFNAIAPPMIAALRLPFTLLLGFLLVLIVDALALRVAADVFPDHVSVASFRDALLAALVIAAVSMVLQAIVGTGDDDTYTLRVVRRIARRQHAAGTDTAGIVFLEIDGLALPVLRRAMRDGNAPTMARWAEDDGYELVEWEPDLSSQTGASQAGILLGSNEDIPAFRWVEKETGTLMTCSAPADCAEIERRQATGVGLLARRRREPRQPALGRGRRGDPDRQPDGGREARQPRLPGVPGQRLQRHARAGAVRVGGGCWSGPRRCGRPAATCDRAGTAAASIRSCAG